MHAAYLIQHTHVCGICGTPYMLKYARLQVEMAFQHFTAKLMAELYPFEILSRLIILIIHNYNYCYYPDRCEVPDGVCAYS